LIEVVREGERVWIRSADFFKRPVRLSLSEAFAIVLGTDLLDSLGFQENPALQRAVDKVQEALSSESHLKLDELTSRVRMRLEPEWYRDVLSKVREAIRKRVSVEATYYTKGRGETTCRKIDPYFLSWSGGQHYLIGFCHLRKGERIFRLENIRDLRLTKDKFNVPASFNPENYAKGAVYIEAPQDIEVKLLFQPSVATWIAEQWSREQITSHKDGSIVLTLKVGNLAWLAKELLEYGDQVKVLEPAELREALLEKARGLREKYEKQ
jgi:predicted DNA-binding transcriptional regulator YafY